MDFCAIDLGTGEGEIIAPTERGYFSPAPRTIGSAGRELRGKIRITCKNGKKAERRFTIEPKEGYRLEIVLE